MIITGYKYFEILFGPNELLLLVGRVVIFGIRANYQPKVCDESHMSLDLNGMASETNVISQDDLGLARQITSWKNYIDQT